MPAPRAQANKVASRPAAAAKSKRRARLELISPAVTCCWVHLAEPQSYMGDNPQYSITLEFPKDKIDENPEYAEFLEKIEKFVAEVQKGYKAKFRDPIVDGDEKDHEYSHGKYLITARSSGNFDAPACYDAAKNLIDSIKIRPGDVVRVVVQLCERDASKSPAGVSIYLSAVQLIEKRSMDPHERAFSMLKVEGPGIYDAEDDEEHKTTRFRPKGSNRPEANERTQPINMDDEIPF